MTGNTAVKNIEELKKSNRGEILNLIYRSGGMSRKDIARHLGLTPAAVTVIVNELIGEGLLCESHLNQTSNHVGRKEVIIDINASEYLALGVYFSRNRIEVTCIDLKNNCLFTEQYPIREFRRRSVPIMTKACEMIESQLAQHPEITAKNIVGVGAAVTGIVDTAQGVSVNSFHVWEKNVAVSQFMGERLGMPVIVTDNVCALAHAEMFYSAQIYPDNLLFIKYGPGIGGAQIFRSTGFSGFSSSPVELGHTIVDYHGQLCSCGNRGCLETICSYESMIKNIEILFSEQNTPYLYSICDGDNSKVDLDAVVKAYEQSDYAVEQVFERSTFYFALAIKNAITLFNPSIVVLYGQLFENQRFYALFEQQLRLFQLEERVARSSFNMRLSTSGPASMVINRFFRNGGIPFDSGSQKVR